MKTLLLTVVLIVCGPYVANAQPETSWRTIRKEFRVCSWDGCRREHRYVRAPAYEPRVYGYERREDVRSHHCRDIRRAVGDQHLTTDGAKKAANDAWAAAVRFHHGEKLMDLNNARFITYTCSRSSIKEGGVSTLGQTLTRCELEAQPCAPLPQTEERSSEVIDR